MTSWDRWRIRLDAWGDVCFRFLPAIMIAAGVALLLAAVVGFWNLW